MQQTRLPIPNPEDWTDAYGAAAIMQVDPSTVLRTPETVLTRYQLGVAQRVLYWVPQVRAVAAARCLIRPAVPRD
jgi:hypothetical protein